MPGRKPSGTKPTLDQVVDITPPDYMTGAGRDQWEVLAPILQDAKVLTEGDMQSLEAYCMAYGMARAANEAVQKHGVLIQHESRGVVQNPACAILKQALSEMRQIGGVLGLDPVNRGKLDVSKEVAVSNPFVDL